MYSLSGISNFGSEDFAPIAEGLLSQQLWCFGQDIERADGNWLLEMGFQRKQPPSGKQNSASLYILKMASKRWLMLRGFGVLVGDEDHGLLFIERFAFKPVYTAEANLKMDPWDCDDMPIMKTVSSEKEPKARLLLLELIEWIIDYETRTIRELGKEYRCQTLERWDNGTRWCVSSDQMVDLWRKLSLAISDAVWRPLQMPGSQSIELTS
ncbi:MAG: hypothetical protein AAF483_16180 [Planctomycetota bacterium]